MAYIPVYWRGSSGQQYEFQTDPIGTNYNPLPGVYIFCKLAANNMWNAVYIGETSDFRNRLYANLTNHHQWGCIASAGATHIGTLHVPGALSKREGIETDLRQAINTPCNEQ
jgi:hypothetical protein